MNALVIYSETIPDTLSLSGVQTDDNHYEAVNIQSSQIIESEKTTYRASNSITLKQELHAKLNASIDNFSNRLNIMTYNLGPSNKSEYYIKHADVISSSGADIIALQEVRGNPNFNRLKNITGLKGEMCVTKGKIIWPFDWAAEDYGICVFWNPSLGTPVITKRKIDRTKSSTDVDKRRAYIIAEFAEFCFISTHYSLDPNDRITMTNKILSESIVINCINSNKPIYIAGDMNEQPGETSINLFENDGFVVLNNTSNSEHSTIENGKHIDLILECNLNQYRELIWRGIPDSSDDSYTISDHLPYFVKLIYK